LQLKQEGSDYDSSSGTSCFDLTDWNRRWSECNPVVGRIGRELEMVKRLGVGNFKFVVTWSFRLALVHTVCSTPSGVDVGMADRSIVRIDSKWILNLVGCSICGTLMT
jgi:hypothetical protein